MTRTRAIPVEDRPKPNMEVTPGLPDFNAPEILRLGEAAKLVGLRAPTLRDAIKKGALPAFIPGGRSPATTGPGNGYRVFRADLQRWFFGNIGVEKEATNG